LGLIAEFSGTSADNPFKEVLVEAVVVAAKAKLCRRMSSHRFVWPEFE
jgi:hypothetical protein